ncbi:MAG: Dna2/Cas4 domain-containing protein [Candidatus Lokiarchaeota archaeon]|nr:Dna2/Cas4 domain-containing protein [Candidatus Lokiarchaeota archaeon]
MNKNKLNKKIISAGDLESFTYCPLSLWLKKKRYRQNRKYTKRGILLHRKIAENVDNIRKMEKKAHTFEQYILPLSIGASIIAIIAIIFHPSWNVNKWRNIFIILSLIWLFHSSFFFYRAEREKDKSLQPKYEMVILISAMISILIALFSFTEFLPSVKTFSRILVILSLGWLVFANIFFYISSMYLVESLLKRKKYNIEKCVIDYVDFGKSSSLLVSEKHGLKGRPDYIITDKEGRHMPVEVKTGVKPRYPYFSHIVQIGVYSLLVEDLYGHCPGGFLRYGNKMFFIRLNEKLRVTIKEVRSRLLKGLQRDIMHRNHARKGKCKNCSMREHCPEKLG